ncbi:hypothetical protein C1752_13896 [Acaryochloris thomasi RCC1774]|uniref:Uncharacterized protein n=1 Tax=Acaryochloris thomasi RCC1774 TaxID=1764569 RepID=A0A2W1JM52_9CYAN|nr:hypothetical protein [Acaryochloris thomasi]PZD70361.1 hypothetical protein C1752_13896 [Acaryochloris thomasi RCC1774]
MSKPSASFIQNNKQLIKPLYILLAIALVEGSAAIQARPLLASTPPGTIMQGQATMSFKAPDNQSVRKRISNNAELKVTEANNAPVRSTPAQIVISDSLFNAVGGTQLEAIQQTAQNHKGQALVK